MSRLFLSLFFLLILSVPIICSEEFNANYLECYLKLEKLKEISTSPPMNGNAASALVDQCYSTHECFKELTNVETLDKNQTNVAEEMEETMRKMCKLLHKLTETFNSQPKFIQCVENNLIEIWNIKEEALAVNPDEDCELTSDQMLTVRSIVVRRCGVAAYRELREQEVIVKKVLCEEGVKKFLEYHRKSNKF